MRKYAREVIFCKIFEYLFSDNQPVSEIDGDLFIIKDLTENDTAYINAIFETAVKNAESYKEKISALLRGYRLERIRKIDLSLLICAMAEIDRGDAPHAVIVNEIVDLSSKYSVEKSSKFINGLLAQYLKELRTSQAADTRKTDGTV